MAEALSFVRAFEVWIYLLLGLGALYYIRKFFLYWQELQGAGFGLERENAQSRLNQAASVLVLIVTMAVSVFLLVSFVAPAVPGAIPLLTPTLDLLTTPTTTLVVSSIQSGQNTVPAGAPATPATPDPQATQAGGGCLTDMIAIQSPTEGQEVSGVVEVIGTADIPNFGFYKFEMKPPDDTNWLTIQAGNTVVKNARLGDWDTRRLQVGEYLLGLVVVDNQARASEHCVVRLRVIPAVEETPGP